MVVLFIVLRKSDCILCFANFDACELSRNEVLFGASIEILELYQLNGSSCVGLRPLLNGAPMVILIESLRDVLKVDSWDLAESRRVLLLLEVESRPEFCLALCLADLSIRALSARSCSILELRLENLPLRFPTEAALLPLRERELVGPVSGLSDPALATRFVFPVTVLFRLEEIIFSRYS